MESSKQTLNNLLELANLYPSPHNGQPVRLKKEGGSELILFFEKSRGLQATDVSYIFSFVTMGVFAEHLRLCAEALGHKMKLSVNLPGEADLRGDGLVAFGKCKIDWHKGQSDINKQNVLRSRRTSRKKYYQGVGDIVSQRLIDVAASEGMKLVRLQKEKAHQAIWLNQRAVFDDMFDEPVRQELDHWLRYTKAQKESTKDGLAYDCMELNGRVLKFCVNHPSFLRLPLLSSVIKRYYLRTMADSSDVFYMLAPFKTENDSYRVGEVIMRIWERVAESGSYLHPFGTIMSNHAAHKDFMSLANETNESRERNYLVFIFRCGKSEEPISSMRLPYKTHLLITE